MGAFSRSLNFLSNTSSSFANAAIDGEPWFVAKDVCDALGIATNHLREDGRGLDDDEVSSLPNWEGKGSAPLVVSEPGFYKLVMRSRKPEAKAFQRWVTHEVLPAIHRDGAYVATDGTEDDMLLMARALKAADRSIKRKDAMIAELRPKALVADAVFAPSKTLYTVTEAARYMADIVPGVKREDLFALLKSTGMMCQRGTAPTRAGIDTGRMVAVADDFVDSNGEVRAGEQRGKLTPKGVAFCIERLAAGEAAQTAPLRDDMRASA